MRDPKVRGSIRNVTGKNYSLMVFVHKQRGAKLLNPPEGSKTGQIGRPKNRGVTGVSKKRKRLIEKCQDGEGE